MLRVYYAIAGALFTLGAGFVWFDPPAHGGLGAIVLDGPQHGGGGGSTLVAHATAGGQTAPTTSALNTTGANFLVATVSEYSGDVTGMVTDSKSNTWVAGPTNVGGDCYHAMFYVCSPTVGASHTFKYDNGANVFGTIQVSAWSGATGSTIDQQNSFSQSGTTSTLQPGSITPSANNTVVVSGVCFADDGGIQTYTVNSPFTVSDFVPMVPTLSEGGARAYRIQTTATAANPTWTDSAAYGNSIASIGSFK
jgi:hypothetical protein